MRAFRYHNPVELRFGWDALDALPEVLGKRDAVLVTFPEAATTGAEARVSQLLGSRLRAVIRDVEPNPEVVWLEARYPQFWKRHGGCAVVAIGGGSVIDTAKLLQAGTANDDFRDVWKALAAGGQPEVTREAPLIAVPTTAGTGSEVTPWATLWDRTSSVPRKYSLHVPGLWPEVALVDPALTLSLPNDVTRNSGLDALSHSLEAIWNHNANPVSDALAVDAARTVIATLPALLARPGDRDLRYAMARAATTAGLAFSNTKTALAHSVSYEMTLKHHLPHGLACSFTLPTVWRMASGVDQERDAVLGQVYGPHERNPASRLEEFLASLGVSTRFEDYGVHPGEAHAMIEDALEGPRGRNVIGRMTAIPA